MMQEEEKPSAEITETQSVKIEVSDTLLKKQKPDLMGQMTINSIVTILVCTAVSMFFMRIGIFSFFYLAPLGFAVIASGSMWYTFFTAAIANFIFSISVSSPESQSNVWFYVLYITTLFLGFTWLIGSGNLRTTYRLIIASAAGAGAFLIEFFSQNSLFYSAFLDIMETISEIFTVPDANSVSVNPIFQNMTDSESMMDFIIRFMLRGGALFSILFLLFINRSIAISLSRFTKKYKEEKRMITFFAPQNIIWVFTGALITIMLTGALKIEIIEILAWNVFVVCCIIYLAQGSAILMHFMEQRGTGFKIGISILIITLLLSPLMLGVFGALLILGVLENWIPFRLQKKNQSGRF